MVYINFLGVSQPFSSACPPIIPEGFTYFFLFSKLNSVLTGPRFQTSDDIETVLSQTLISNEARNRCEKCVTREGGGSTRRGQGPIKSVKLIIKFKKIKIVYFLNRSPRIA